MPPGVKGFQKGNAGKPEGAVMKSTKLIKDVFVDAFNALQEDPKANLVTWAKENPADFYKLGIRIVPTQVQISANVSITDEPIIFE